MNNVMTNRPGSADQIKSVEGAALENAISRNRAIWKSDGGKCLRHPLFDQALARAAMLARKGSESGELAGMLFFMDGLFDAAGFDKPDYASASGATRPVSRNAALLARLLRSDAVLLGISESAAGGIGLAGLELDNPVWPGRIAGGSPTGAAIALAHGMGDAALVRDTSGDARIAAASCGLVGFKPTRDALSLRGCDPVAPTLDHAALLGRNVETVMRAMRGFAPPRYMDGAFRVALPKRVAVDQDVLETASPHARDAIRTAVAYFQENGAQVHTVRLPDHAGIAEQHWRLYAFEAARSIGPLSDRSRKLFSDSARSLLEFGHKVEESDYDRALAACRAFTRAVQKQLRAAELVLLPTLATELPLAGALHAQLDGRQTEIDRALAWACLPFNHSGQPALALPANPVAMVPGGASVQIAGQRGSDLQILQIGRNLESVFRDAYGGEGLSSMAAS